MEEEEGNERGRSQESKAIKKENDLIILVQLAEALLQQGKGLMFTRTKGWVNEEKPKLGTKKNTCPSC